MQESLEAEIGRGQIVAKPIAAKDQGGLPHAGFLFETIVCDFHWTALNIGAITSLLNAAEQLQTISTLRSWRHALLPDGQAMLLALKFAERAGLDGAAASAIGTLCVEIDAKKIPLLALLKSGDTPGTKNSVHQPTIQSHASQWRRLSDQAIKALEALDPATRRQLEPSYATNSGVLVGFLREAQTRTNRHVSSNGLLKLPAIVQRRRTARRAVAEGCKLVLANGMVAEAGLDDASRAGLGLTCRERLQVGQLVTIELNDGRRIRGTVAWTRGDRYGLSLTVPLSLHDRLLRGRKCS